MSGTLYSKAWPLWSLLLFPQHESLFNSTSSPLDPEMHDGRNYCSIMSCQVATRLLVNGRQSVKGCCISEKLDCLLRLEID